MREFWVDRVVGTYKSVKCRELRHTNATQESRQALDEIGDAILSGPK